MGYERSVITMTLLRLGYLIHSLGNCAMTLPAQTGAMRRAECIRGRDRMQMWKRDEVMQATLESPAQTGRKHCAIHTHPLIGCCALMVVGPIITAR